MDRKILGTGIGVVFVVGLLSAMSFAFAQEPEIAPTAAFVDDDGVCDNAGSCPMHQNGGGCHGGCARHATGFSGGCHGPAAG